MTCALPDSRVSPLHSLARSQRRLTWEFESIIVSRTMAIAGRGQESSTEQGELARPVVLSPPKDELLELARAAATGHEGAARTLMTTVAGSMLRTVRKVLGAQHPDVDDVMQDAVIAFISALAEFRGDCYVKHYANRIAVLTAMAARRRLRSKDRLSAPNVALSELEDRGDVSPLGRALAARRRDLLRQLLDDMPESIAEALALRFMLGYSVEEIAVAADVPTNTVWSRLRLGKQRLRKVLTDARLLDELGALE